MFTIRRNDGLLGKLGVRNHFPHPTPPGLNMAEAVEFAKKLNARRTCVTADFYVVMDGDRQVWEPESLEPAKEVA